jgi:hypothetical protein
MNLHADVKRLFASCKTGDGHAVRTEDEPADLDLRRLPFADAAFAAIELDDVPEPDAWVVSGPALNEIRRVLQRHGLLELRTRCVPAGAGARERERMGALTRLLQNHGFEVVSVDAVEGDGSMISAIARTCDAPEEDATDGAARNRALAVSLDAQGVKVRVRVIFDVLDALYCD